METQQSSSPRFDKPTAQQFNVFLVTQLAPTSFLDRILGLDHVLIPPHSISEIHRHNNSDNMIFVLAGRATIVLDGKEHELSPSLRVLVPRGVWHGFRTFEEPLVFVSAQIPPILDKANNVFDREIQPS
jgi:mannose-6-phosphate isomerase-like protein (cupin superfamily)